MIYLPKRLFIGAKDISGSDDFYLYQSLSNPISWKQIYYRPAEATGALADLTMPMYHFNNIAIISIMDGWTTSWSYISYDRGTTWSLLITPFVPATFAATSDLEIYACTNGTLYRSTNKCASWSTIGSYLAGWGTITLNIFIYPPNTVVICSDDGVYKSTSGGITGSWSYIPNGSINNVRYFQFGNSILAFDVNGNTALSLNQGSTWSSYASPDPLKICHDADFCDSQHNIIAMTLEDTLYISNNLGVSWSYSKALGYGHLYSIINSYAKNFICTNDSGLYITTENCGDTFNNSSFNSNPNIIPFSAKKISAQSSIAFSSPIQNKYSSLSPISKTLSIKCGIEI